MAGLKQARANAILDSELRGSTRFLALYTAAPTATAGGTEVAGNGYARQTITFAVASGGSSSNSGAITFPAATGGGWGTINAWAVVDSGGTQYVFKAITPVTVNGGDVVKFLAGDIVVTAS